jgi:hypothetical protein
MGIDWRFIFIYNKYWKLSPNFSIGIPVSLTLWKLENFLLAYCDFSLSVALSRRN